MKKFKKLLSIVLSLCLIASLIPAVGFASDKTAVETGMYKGEKDLKLGLASDGVTRPTITKIPGIYGKAESDIVYKVEVNPNKDENYSYSSGYNHLNLEKARTLDTTIAEFSFLNPGGVNFIAGIGLLKTPNESETINVTDETTGETTEVTNVVKATLFKITDGVLKLGYSDTFFAKGYSNKIICTIPEGEWVNVAFVIPGYDSYQDKENYENKTLYMYINGVKHEIGIAADFYGLRHLRFAPNAAEGESAVFYYDNIVSYLGSSAAFDETEEAQPVVDFGDFKAEDKIISITNGTTVSQFKSQINTNANVRVFKDDAYKDILSDNDVILPNSKVVFGANNGRNDERAYSYYTTEYLVYEEPSGMYDGERELTLGMDNRSVRPEVSVVSGNYGKDKEDKVYRVDVNREKDANAVYSSGYNFLQLDPVRTLDTTVSEFSFLNPGGVNFIMEVGLYLSEKFSDEIIVTNDSGEETKVSNLLKSTLFQITDGKVKLAVNENFFAKEYSGKVLCELPAAEWINVAFVVPCYNSNKNKDNYQNRTLYMYINGVEYEIGTVKDFYAVRHIRFAPYAAKGESKTFYYDNIAAYHDTTSSFDAKREAQPNVSFGELSVSDKSILSDGDLTVAYFEEQISTTANMRIYEDSTYEKLLSGGDSVPIGAKVVFAANNNRTKERAYSYYTIGKAEYKEPDLYEGSMTLTLGADNRSVKPTVTPVEGVFGKAKSDTVYRVDINKELDATAKYGTGYNFLSLDSGRTLDTTVAEFSFLNPGDVNFSMEVSMFTSAATTDKINVTDQTGASSEVTNLHKGVLISVAGGEIKIGNTANFLADGFSGKILGKAPAGQWTNVAVVIPGYNSYQNKENYTNKVIYVYVNGVKNEVTLAKNIYGVRHVRLAPDGDTGTSKTFYYDNIRKYTGASERYDAKKDLKPVVDFSLADVYEDNITVEKGTTVSDFEKTVNVNGAVRVFSDSTYEKQLEADDEMGLGNVVVFATSNNRTTERAYFYCTVNKSVSVGSIKLTNADSKIIRGSQADIDRIGEIYYFNTTVLNKSSNEKAKLLAVVASYEASGKIASLDVKPIEAGSGKTVISVNENPVAFENIVTPVGGCLKAFLWLEADNRPLCDEFKAVFNGIEEYSVLAFGNSYSEDAFTYLPRVAKAAGIDIYAVNMYRGGCPLSTHLNHMNGDGVYQQRVEYLPDGTSIKTADVSFIDGLNTPGYSWDYISLQSRSVEAYDYKYFEPYLTPLAEFIRQNSPASEVLMHQTWVLDTQTAKEKTQTKDLVAEMEDSEIRPYLFGLLKNNYIAAAEQIQNPGRIVPVGEAVNYAIAVLGFPECAKNASGEYDKTARGMFRDTTCHLSTEHGRVLAALTWYEYLTGHNAEENPYQKTGITEKDMALLKQAAHWACSQSDYTKK